MILVSRKSLVPLQREPVSQFDAQKVNFRLLHRQIGHLDIHAARADCADRLLEILDELGLTNFVEHLPIWNCHGLMELSEQLVKVNCKLSVADELVPERSWRQLSVVVLELVNYLSKVPREAQNIGVASFIESEISPNLLIFKCLLLFWTQNNGFFLGFGDYSTKASCSSLVEESLNAKRLTFREQSSSQHL